MTDTFDPQDPTTWPDHLVIGVGMVAAAVCTRGTDDEACGFLNTTSPTGIDSRWQPSNDVKVPWIDDDDPEPGPRQCPDDPSRRHVGFCC